MFILLTTLEVYTITLSSQAGENFRSPNLLKLEKHVFKMGFSSELFMLHIKVRFPNPKTGSIRGRLDSSRGE